MVYPEMFAPRAALLGTYEVACAESLPRARLRAALVVVVAFGIAALACNRLAHELLVQRALIGTGDFGWNIYGPHRPALGFVASVAGLTNIVAGPIGHHVATASLAALLLAGGLVHAVATARRERDASMRGLLHLGWLFFGGIAALFFVIARRGHGNNYIAVKFIFGFGWVAYVILGLAILRTVRWGRHAGYAMVVAFVVLGADLSRTALHFSESLERANQEAMFLESEVDACRELLGGDPKVYVAAPMFNLATVGQFIAHDRDLLTATGHWPGGLDRDGGEGARGASRQLTPLQPVLLMGRDYALRGDPKVTGAYQPVCSGRHFTLLRPALE